MVLDNTVHTTKLNPDDLRDIWPVLTMDDRLEGFRLLEREDAADFFSGLSSQEQADVILSLSNGEQRLWIRQLAPDDAADVLQIAPDNERPELMNLLGDRTRQEVIALLAYDEDEAGGLMSPRFARLRPDLTVDEAIDYLRRQAGNQLETIYYAYVLNRDQKLLGVVSFRELFAAKGDVPVREVMVDDFVSVTEDEDQEEVGRLMSIHDIMAIPVLDAHGTMKGIITYDDIADVMEEEVTEDIHKMGGLQSLETPYLQTGIGTMVRKRGVWLSILLVGEMLTTTALARYEAEIARAVVLTLFIPLIISSGGNAGSQATTLIIRAMALNEVRLKDWWRVMWREFASGLCLGGILAVLGLARVLLGEALFHSYGEHAFLLSLAVGISLIGVVTWGALIGSALPLILDKLKLDPAAASAPFVATLVDVFGLVIYFSVAEIILRGTML